MRGYNSIIIFSLLLIGCNYRHDKTGDGFNETSFKSTTPISWETVKSKVLVTCFTCHSSGSSPEINSYGSVVKSFDGILKASVDNVMPPVSKGYKSLSACQKSILQYWQKLSFPQESSATVADDKECSLPNPVEIPIQVLEPNYTNFKERILQPYCIRCHNINDPDPESSGILFDPYEEIQKKKGLFKGPGAQSKMVKILTALDDDRMPPPEEGAGLKPEEIDFVIRWIDAGVPQ